MQIKRPVFSSVTLTIACAAALSCFLFTTPARAEEVKAGDLVVTQAWSRATPNGAKIAGGYLTKVEVHEMAMDNGVMKMRPLDQGLTIEPGKTVKLAPGGYHLMMFDLKSQLKQGDKVPVTLEFEKAGKVTVSLDVQGIGAQAPGGAGAPMDMQKTPGHSDMKM
jgi:copper(I)-binding protein